MLRHFVAPMIDAHTADSARQTSLIINISSGTGHSTFNASGNGVYSTSKWAVESLSKCVAMSVRPRRHVSTLAAAAAAAACLHPLNAPRRGRAAPAGDHLREDPVTQHGLSSKNMALITSNCDEMRSIHEHQMARHPHSVACVVTRSSQR